ncbi:hypothetical protein ACS0TY_034662 [Phlomoides rotata]
MFLNHGTLFIYYRELAGELSTLYRKEEKLSSEVTIFWCPYKIIAHYCHVLTRLSVIIQRKHKETEHVLLDLEERLRQTNVTIKEKEFLISNLLKSEKALVERVHELRSELEDTASDITNLFTKIERKDKIEEGNRVLIRFSPS